jgi:DeoR/GlpR family transcriptional regulator of sugar metabolism
MQATKPKRLLTEERRRAVMDLLEKQGRVTVEELTRQFGVSAVTARGDLDVLSTSGALVRSHGGAVRPLNPVQDYPLKIKKSIHHAEKIRIARAATQLIQNHQTVILDSGTTCAEIAANLRRTKPMALTVITHALNIAVELADAPNVSLIMIGGILRQVSSSFVGPQAEQMVRDLHADHLFLAVDGLDLEVGLTTPDILEAQLNALMMKTSREVTVVADASKFGRRSLSVIGDLSMIKRVITDDRVPPECVEGLRDRGIEVILA